MRFAVFVRATEETEAGNLPTPEDLALMGAFNETLVRAGVLLAAEGLNPTSKGTRLRFSGERPTVTDGPFAETKELICGFWIVQGKSKEEIVERFSRVPFTGGQEIEIRQIFEADDFAEVLTPELRERGAALREKAL